VSSDGGHRPNLPAWGGSSGPFRHAQFRRGLCLACWLTWGGCDVGPGAPHGTWPLVAA
jgi:hypothetical protein